MTSQNDITGNPIRSRSTTDRYRENYDKIFTKSKDSANANQQREDGITQEAVRDQEG